MDVMFFSLLRLSFFVVLLTSCLAGAGATKEAKEMVASLAEQEPPSRQQIGVHPFSTGFSPTENGQGGFSPADRKTSLNGQTAQELPPKKTEAGSVELSRSSIWYTAAILALIGMLISSLVANRIRAERDAARQASRLKSDFLASVSHEIRTPMNAILGFSQILKAQLHDERHQQYINAITTSGNTLLRLINDLLDLAKIEAGKFELHPTAVALKSIALEIQTIFIQVIEEKRLEFHVDLHPSLPDALYLDEVRLRQILYNLLKNAVKFTDKGRISLSMRPLTSPGAGKFDLEIVVADTGIGIPLEEQETIFEAFTQRKSQDHSKYAGNGLGLSITRRLVEIIGGEIYLQSEVGKGSTFTAILRRVPVAPEGAAALSAKDTGEEAIRFDQNAVILVIDAIDSSRMVIREFLRATKIAVVETISVADGIDWCMAIKPDLILLDYTMACFRDAVLVERFNRVKEELNISVVAVTSTSSVGSEEFQTDFHFDGWLKKPLLHKDVMETLARYLPNSTLYQSGEDGSFADVPRSYALPDPAKVQAAISRLGDRLPSFMRILTDNMMFQFNENKETFIINEIKTFALEVQRLAIDFKIELLGDWAAELLSRIRTFDMERLPLIFNLFPELVALVETAADRVKQSGV
jgi:signal transduction histidine kinase/CheY-like chemotaxis protein